MDFSWIGEAQTWIGFATLIILEIVLGIDNLVFIAILAEKVKPKDRDKARLLGLGLALIIRIFMLGMISLIITMKDPIFPNPVNFEIAGFKLYSGIIGITGKDLIMFFGGLFLLYKATMELHERLEGHDVLPQNNKPKVHAALSSVVLQIVVLDAVFSLDSVITAVAMIKHIEIAMAAVIVAMGAMIWASKPLTNFVSRHPTVVMLCLGFLLMIGFSLLAEAFHFEIPKQYLYAAIGFSILIEIFNQVAMKNRQETAATARGWRNRTADAVLGMMRVRENAVFKEKHHASDHTLEDESLYEDNEKQMIRRVLTLAERPVPAVMTPRRDVARVDISLPKEEQIEQLTNSPFSNLVAIGKAGIDDPLGYISKKDLLLSILSTKEFNINEIIRQPLVIPEITTVLDALELFRKKSAGFAFVVDEFGSLLGILTIKDLLESIAGDFPELYETPEERSIQTNADKSLTVEGSFEMPILEQEIGLIPLYYDEVDFHTVAGFMIEELERIPEVGEWVDHQGWRFEVIEKEGQRIERIKVYPSPETEE